MSGKAFKINFTLRAIDDIVPWGENRDYLSWFGLTDSDLWITAGERTIYEYSDAARKKWDCGIRYNDYQLSRFLEDFSGIFGAVSESVPEEYYNIIDEIPLLFGKWLGLHSDNDDDDAFDLFFDNEYEPLTQWAHDRVFDSGHLIGGPNIGCFRCGDMLKLWWFSDYTLENGESIWTAPSGVFEMSYGDFTSEVRRFFGEFFEKMDEQVQSSLAKDWGKVALDKARLAEEHAQRREGFEQKTALLDECQSKTDWNAVRGLFEKMLGEIG